MERNDDMAWNLDSDRPIYAQLLERIQLQIVSGIYPPGGKLPSVRELAAEASVNPNTMHQRQIRNGGYFYDCTDPNQPRKGRS